MENSGRDVPRGTGQTGSIGIEYGAEKRLEDTSVQNYRKRVKETVQNDEMKFRK